MEVRVLGPLEVVQSAQPMEVRGRRQRGLLARLAVDANRVVSVEALLDELWAGRPPARAKEALQSQVSRLRRSLGGDGRLMARSPGYMLRLRVDELDAARFESLVVQAKDAARRSEAHRVAALLAEAEGCWRGPALGEFFDYPTVHAEGTRLDQVRITATEEMMAAELTLGHHDQVVAPLEALVVLHPLRERLWAHLILALYRAGRQGDALRAYSELRLVLGEQLGIEPSAELVRLEEAVLLQKPELDWHPPKGLDQPQTQGSVTVAAEARRPLGNLPAALSSFVGRVEELSRLGRMLEDTRLLTLTGPGGMGKTRLALELAGRLVGFPDGVWVVELASVTDPELVPQLLATVLAVSEQPGRAIIDTLTEQLAAHQLLVVLDNCEHLVGACARLAERLLSACPGVRLLATSREPLRVPNEIVWALAPLARPGQHMELTLPALLSNDSTRLLVDRARSVRPQLVLHDADIDAIADLCRRLEGIPLAIELAAARASVLSFEQLRARLDGRLRICASTAPGRLPRHRSVQASLDWSYDLLSQSEQTLLRGLSVFAAGFTLEAVEAFWRQEPDGDQLLDLLGSLVDKSLVLVDHQRGPRYRLLEVVRQYATHKLNADEAARRREQHRDLYLRVAEAAEPVAVGAERGPVPAVIDVLEAEHDNLRAALAWSLEAPIGDDGGLRLAHALHPLWQRHLDEGRRTLDAILARGSDNQGLLSAVTRRAAVLANTADDAAATVDLTRRALALARHAGDPLHLGRAMFTAGALAVIRGEIIEAQSSLERAQDLLQHTGQRDFMAQCLSFVALLALRRGEYDEGRSLAHQVLDSYPDAWIAGSHTLTILGQIEREQGHLAAARHHLERCMTLHAENKDPNVDPVIAELGALAWEEGDLESARREYERLLDMSRPTGRTAGIALALAGLAELAEADQAHESAASLIDEAAEQAKGALDVSIQASVLKRLGDVRASGGHLDLADNAYREALDVADRARMPSHQAASLDGLAFIELARHRPQAAGQLSGAAAALRTRIGAAPSRTVLTSVNNRSARAEALPLAQLL